MEKDWVLSHLALHVRDLDKIADYYQSIGIGVRGTERQGPPPPPGAKKSEMVTLNYGKVSDRPIGTRPTASFLLFVHIGDMALEVTKMSPPSPMWDRLESKGETIHHVCFNVADLHGDSVPLIEKGCQVPFTLISNNLILENHIETNKFGGVILSLRPDNFFGFLDGGRSETEKAYSASLGVSNWKFRGMGIAVEDMDKLVEYYQFLGIGTFQPEVIFDSSSIADFKVNGKPSDTIVKARTRMAQVGPLVYEFTQPLEGEAIYKESLDRRGEGVNDFVFTVGDLDQETAKLVEKGVPVILSGKPQTGSAFAYFDTRKVGNMMMKLIQAE